MDPSECVLWKLGRVEAPGRDVWKMGIVLQE